VSGYQKFSPPLNSRGVTSLRSPGQ
jgi:hypothetical protein